MIEFIQSYWLQVIFAGILGGLALARKSIWARIKHEVEEQKKLKDGIIAILHDRLYQLCGEYIKEGRVSISELNNLKYIYLSYHKLGGNGTGEELYHRCLKLEIVED